MEMVVMNNIYDGVMDYNNYRNVIKLGLIQNYTSVQWLTEFNDCGEFCIECVATKENIKILQPNNLVVRNDINEWCIGIIQKVSIKEDKMVIRGNLDALDRVLNMQIDKITNIKEGLRKILTEKSHIPFILHKTSTSAETDISDILYKNYREILQKVCTENDLGYAMSGEYNVVLYAGNIITNTLLSDMLDNIIDQAIDMDYVNIKSKAIVLGEEKDGKSTVVTVDNPIDVHTYAEVFVDAKSTSRKYKDADGNEKIYTEKEYEDILIKQGLEKLSTFVPKIKFSCEVNDTYKHLTMGIDYRLGDIIRVKSIKYDYSVNMRITKVKEIFEKSKKVIITLENKEGLYGN